MAPVVELTSGLVVVLPVRRDRVVKPACRVMALLMLMAPALPSPICRTPAVTVFSSALVRPSVKGVVASAPPRLIGVPVVFCRNAFIYFSPQSVRRVVENLAALMPEPGYLCIGASESLLNLTTAFRLEEVGGAFVYVKQGRDD